MRVNGITGRPLQLSLTMQPLHDLRQLDALLAEHAAGWTAVRWLDGEPVGCPPLETAAVALPTYSASLELMMRLSRPEWYWTSIESPHSLLLVLQRGRENWAMLPAALESSGTIARSFWWSQHQSRAAAYAYGRAVVTLLALGAALSEAAEGHTAAAAITGSY